MENIIRQSVGLDISMDHFHASFCVRHLNGQLKHKGKVREFENTPLGLRHLAVWIEKMRQDSSLDVKITMEATGVYHEQVAYWAHENAYSVSVLLPNTVKAYGHSFNFLSKTDIIDARLLARMGAERQLRNWSPMSPKMLNLKRLNRLRQSLVKTRTAVNNRLHAEQKSARPVKDVVASHKRHLKFLVNELAIKLRKITALVKKDEVLEANIARLCTIPGVGVKTAVLFLAETDGLTLFTSQRQLISFCGYDIKHKDSGTSVHGQARISKSGNGHIRGGLYMPSLTAMKYGKEFERAYNRVFERTGKGRMALVAVQRKMLNVMFACHKKQEDYNAAYALQSA